MCKIHQYLVKIWARVWRLWPIMKVELFFCFRYTSCICNHKTTILSYRMGQKLSSKLLFIYSPNSDGFYIFYISQGSVATQLRCVGMFSTHFITNFPQNATVNIWQRFGQNFVDYFLGHPVHDIMSDRLYCYFLTCIVGMTFDHGCRQLDNHLGQVQQCSSYFCPSSVTLTNVEPSTSWPSCYYETGGLHAFNFDHKGGGGVLRSYFDSRYCTWTYLPTKSRLAVLTSVRLSIVCR